MALPSVYFSVYVALQVVILTLFNLTVTNAGSGSSNILSLLQPYDFLYYSGVRAYFGEEWEKAAELLEKSILTKDALFEVRRQCHKDCATAGRNALHKLGKFSELAYYVFQGARI